MEVRYPVGFLSLRVERFGSASNNLKILTGFSSHKFHISIFVNDSQAEWAQNKSVSVGFWQRVSCVRVFKAIQEISDG